jgi:prepilin-type N-terminal cleavage/methylation domain-containing protein
MQPDLACVIPWTVMDQGPIAVTPARDQRGFTLIEMMIAVAVIAILAIIVVPTFFRESRKVKSATEIQPMFAEMSTKEEQAKVNGGLYLTADTACPGTASSTGNPSAPCTSSAQWVALRINPPVQTLYCSYVIEIGSGAGTSDPSGFQWDSPAADWYYIIATCDMDGDSTGYSTYFMSSSDPKIQKQNEGK